MPPTQSVWKREIHFRFMEKPLGLAWIMLFESAIALTLVGTGIYQIADPARPAIRAYFSGSPAETITMQFQWLRASEFLVPLLVLGALFLWAGIAIIVAKHQGMAVAGASRAVVTAGCVGQIAVPIAAAAWWYVAPAHTLFFGEVPGWNILLYPNWVPYLFGFAAILLLAGTVISAREILRHRLSLSPVWAIVSTAVLVTLLWMPISAANAQLSVSFRQPPAFGFWESQPVSTGIYSGAVGVSCVEDSCRAAASGLAGAHPTFNGSSTSSWSTAVLSNATWRNRGRVEYSEPFGPTSISCVSARVCLVAGRASPLTNHPFVWRTNDGGSTWTRIGLRPPTEPNSGGPAVRCTGSLCIVIDGNEAQISQDGGLTWQTSFVSPSPPGARTKQSNFLLTSMNCATSSSCLMFGLSYDASTVVLSSSDGGISWVSHTGPPGFSEVGEIRCTGETCYAVGVVGRVPPYSIDLLRTTDNGASWKDLGRIPDIASAEGLACPAVSRCIAFGLARSSNNALAVSTADDGTSWHDYLVFHEPEVPGGFSCATTDVCAAIGIGVAGTVVTSTSNGGQTWHQQNYPRGQ